MRNATMARPKAKPKAQTPGKPNPIALTIRGSVEWREWVDRGAEHCRTDVAKVVDAALIEYFKGKGFTELPPKR